MKPVRYSKRVHLLILLFIVMVGIVIRFPITPHQLGADSYQIHAYGEIITEKGYASWVVHPLSFTLRQTRSVANHPVSYSYCLLLSAYLFQPIIMCPLQVTALSIWLLIYFQPVIVYPPHHGVLVKVISMEIRVHHKGSGACP